jgi:REP element-mobilizing transposase RayT
VARFGTSRYDAQVMGNYDYKSGYRRNLPHLQPEGATIFVTFRLVDSIPKVILARWREERNQLQQQLSRLSNNTEREAQLRQFQRSRFAELENLLDCASEGEHWLRQPPLAQIVEESLQYRDEREYRLDVYCVMSNHVHVLFLPLPKADGTYHALQTILHSLKRHTARQCNQLLEREGSFWENESFDHYIRDHDEWVRVIHYILNNPVKAGIVQNWRDYPFSYCSEQALPYVTI